MAKPKILVADTDARVVQAINALGRRLDYEVVSTASGREVIALAALHQPRLVVVDIKLPDSDGRDLLKQIKRDPRVADIPVVLCSQRDYESDRAIALELGASAYAAKDELDLHGVLAEIQDVLASSNHRKA